MLPKNYFTITKILDNYHEVLNTLSKTCPVKPKTFIKVSSKPFSTDAKLPNGFNENEANKSTR